MITILGSCRQHSIKKKYDVTDIQEELSYPHYTKEVLEVIKFLKYRHIHPENEKFIFRTPILEKKAVNYANLHEQFLNTKLFVLEIASKIKYTLKGCNVHHIANELNYDVPFRNEIVTEIQDKNEIENDILKIREELNKPFIIISHINTRNYGERYILTCWLEEICSNHNIPFINPIKELSKRNVNITHLFIPEKSLAHYTDYGHSEILKVYQDYIDKLI